MSDGAPTFAFQATGPGAAEGYTLVLGRPDEDGRVAYRRYSPAAEPVDLVEAAAELEARVEAWRRDGWTFSEHPGVIRAWLRERPR